MTAAPSKIFAAPLFAVSLVAMALAGGNAHAQALPPASPYGAPVVGAAAAADGYYDYARVVRVIPVVGAPEGYPAAGQRCTTREEPYVGGYGANDGHGTDRDPRYQSGDYYGPDGRYHAAGEAPARNPGTEGGRTMAGVLGTVIGAVVGSQVGGGSARYATAAIGSAVGGVAGRQVYDNAHRDYGPSSVTVCDPVDAARPVPASRALYDVVYEYGGRNYMTRMAYDPGERIRVRVDVRPE